jgi:predicted transcriptional regulator
MDDVDGPRRELEVLDGALERAASEVAAAWKGAEAGRTVEPTDKLYFADWAALCAVLTPKRYELLRHLHRTPADSIRALARALDRDVKRVHEDVVALAELGLIERDPSGRLTMPLDAISSTIRFAA